MVHDRSKIMGKSHNSIQPRKAKLPTPHAEPVPGNVSADGQCQISPQNFSEDRKQEYIKRIAYFPFSV